MAGVASRHPMFFPQVSHGYSDPRKASKFAESVWFRPL